MCCQVSFLFLLDTPTSGHCDRNLQSLLQESVAGQRLWLSWQSSCFKPEVPARFQSSAKFIPIENLFTVNCIEKAKIKKKMPGMDNFFKKERRGQAQPQTNVTVMRLRPLRYIALVTGAKSLSHCSLLLIILLSKVFDVHRNRNALIQFVLRLSASPPSNFVFNTFSASLLPFFVTPFLCLFSTYYGYVF